jgi:2-dehydro-3-deoxygluconokinase
MPRSTRLIYDRADSAFTTLRYEDIDWGFFKTARLVHLSGITPALGKSINELTHQIIDRVKPSGTLISFDVNYRSKLWAPSMAQKILAPIVEKVDVLICSLTDAATVFQVQAADAEDVAKGLHQTYCNQTVVLTMADKGALAFDGKTIWYQDAYEAAIVDRIGRGDSFSAGFLYGFLHHDTPTGLKYGNAMAALNQTLKGDFFWCGREEVEQLIAGHSKTLDR